MTEDTLITEDQKNRMIAKANQFKREGKTHEEFLKICLDLPRKDGFKEIYDLRDFYKILRKIPAEQVTEEQKDELYLRTHSYKHHVVEQATIRQKEKIHLIYGKALKMLKVFEEQQLAETNKRSNSSMRPEKSVMERDKYGTRNLEKTNNRSRF